MLAATTFAAAIALITDAGPEAQSPPANTPGMLSIRRIFRLRSYLSVQEHRLLQSAGIQYPTIATISVWHGMNTSGAPVGRTLARPSLILLIICGVT